MTKKQLEIWRGEFGSEYTSRNTRTVSELDQLYDARFGITRTKLNREFLGDFDREIRILEVGTNIGLQLEILREMGFSRLYGIDIQQSALQKARQTRPYLGLAQGGASHLPFADESFDLVCTSALLIHIPPAKLSNVVSEIASCSSKWIFGYEYFAPEHQEVQYRGRSELLWKGDFPSIYEEIVDVDIRRQEHLVYPDGEKEDRMFLLEKT